MPLVHLTVRNLRPREQTLFGIVEKTAKEFFAKNPDAKRHTKSKHPKSHLVK